MRVEFPELTIKFSGKCAECGIDFSIPGQLNVSDECVLVGEFEHFFKTLIYAVSQEQCVGCSESMIKSLDAEKESATDKETSPPT